MEIGSAVGSNVQTVQPQPAQQQETQRTEQQQRQGEAEVARLETPSQTPDPGQRVGSVIDTQV
ncbi:hypothetical protein [Lacimicrobium alkaliphilum]|uniref:Uncharacterized protein n=1 Tax=Lacimicrobium alkaliphilum TaxID=1526571 RepID=A0ABQ1R3Q4_9ALTE|nr:hypothetical protein [Lacimicrobium alkaliphilum]GGD55310.1 hypothetical protein GCM10011357_08770 [Lacimicrobium alkaliphilum]